jgi:KamA family protein
MKSYTGERLADLAQVQRLPAELRRDIRVVAHVLPFKVNNYVVDQLIDWSNIPDDPIYRLTFPHRDMLLEDHYETIARLIDRGAARPELRAAADRIRRALNPHPAGQLEKNIPVLNGERMQGLQHKYRETVLCFPSNGQTCHSYCGYCFRWAQFVGIADLKQMNRDVDRLVTYVRAHRCVTDVLFTGGDPMVMSTKNLERYVEPLLADDLDHVQSLRFGTKSLAYWPYRFTTDRDSDAFLRLVERCVKRGRHVAIMAHFTHPNELRTSACREAVRRLQGAGALIRTQSPIVRTVNDDASIWADMWTEQVRLNLVPYYMFVERDTGARRYYEIPLVRAWEVYREALKSVSGLARTVRGPSMSATPGKVVVDGVDEIGGERVLCLRFLQGRNPDWFGRPFHARYNESATWLGDLKPAFGADRFFFEEDPIQDWRQVE